MGDDCRYVDMQILVLVCHMRRKQLLADNECINEALQPRGADRDKEMSIIVV